MSEEIKPQDGAIPPRVTIKVPGVGGETQSPDPALVGKKKTARLSLDQVTAEPGAAHATSVEGMGVASKTIRLAPAMTGQMGSALPSLGKALSGTLVGDDIKRQTSRIPLESVLSGATGAGGTAVPKTIKVKRPTFSVTSNIPAPKVDEPEPVAPPVGAMTGKNQTARVDISPDMIPEPQQTQKKTIKIRRADGGEMKAAEPRSVSIARLEGSEGAAPMAKDQVAKPHGIFVGIAAAALLVLCFMIYVLAAQAYPNLGWSV